MIVKRKIKMKFKIELIDIGRDKKCQEYKLEADDLNECANLVYAKILNFLTSSDVQLCPDEEHEEYWTVFAGFHNVGKVKIMEIK
jgi:hypothetical protein